MTEINGYNMLGEWTETDRQTAPLNPYRTNVENRVSS